MYKNQKRKKNKSLSISVLLILLNSVILAIGFIVLLNQNINTLKTTAQVQGEKNLRTFSGVLKPLINANAKNLDSFAKSIASHTTDFRVTIVDSSGKVLADSDVKLYGITGISVDECGKIRYNTSCVNTLTSPEHGHDCKGTDHTRAKALI